MSHIKNEDAKTLLNRLELAIADCDRLKKENEELRKRLDEEIKQSVQVKKKRQ